MLHVSAPRCRFLKSRHDQLWKSCGRQSAVDTSYSSATSQSRLFLTVVPAGTRFAARAVDLILSSFMIPSTRGDI